MCSRSHRAGVSMFFMRFMLGFSEAPSFPANARIVAAPVSGQRAGYGFSYL